MTKKQIAKTHFDTEIITLDNGLRVSVDEMREVETVSIGVFVNTGSRNENLKINGISHFLEHMAFKGTKTRNAKQIAEEFEGIGGHINAYTSKEKTVYYVKVLKKYSEFAVEFLADILQNSIFDKVELEKERGVILQEIAMTNDTPDDIVFDYFQNTAYPNQELGRSILGEIDNVKNFTRNDFVKYIKNQYNFSNIAVVASGNITQNDLVKWTKKYFNNLSENKIAKVKSAKYFGGEFRKEKKLEQVNIVFGFKGISYLDKNYYKSQILAMILGGGMSSRLFQEVRENLGLAYSVYAFNSCYCDSGLFAIYAGTTPEKCNQLLDTTKNEIEKICQKITKEELQRVITQFQASLLMAKESTSSRMQRRGIDIISLNHIVSDAEIHEQLAEVSLKNLTDFASEIFYKSDPTIAMIGKVKKVKNFLM
jgi:predicted Zn-dependent peptidase